MLPVKKKRRNVTINILGTNKEILKTFEEGMQNHGMPASQKLPG